MHTRDLVGFVGWSILICILTFSAVFAILYTLNEYKCSSFGNATKYETITSGLKCYVKLDDGRVVPQEYVYGDAVELRVGE